MVWRLRSRKNIKLMSSAQKGIAEAQTSTTTQKLLADVKKIVSEIVSPRFDSVEVKLADVNDHLRELGGSLSALSDMANATSASTQALGGQMASLATNLNAQSVAYSANFSALRENSSAMSTVATHHSNAIAELSSVVQRIANQGQITGAHFNEYNISISKQVEAIEKKLNDVLSVIEQKG